MRASRLPFLLSAAALLLPALPGAASRLAAADFDLRYTFQSTGMVASLPLFGSLKQMRFAQRGQLRLMEIGDILQIDDFALRTSTSCSHRQKSCVVKRGTPASSSISAMPEGKWEKTSEQRFGLPVEKFSFSAQVPLGQAIFSEIWLIPGRDKWQGVATAFQVVQSMPAIDNSLYLAPPGYVPIRYRISSRDQKAVGELRAELAESRLSAIPASLFKPPAGYVLNQLQARPVKPKK